MAPIPPASLPRSRAATCWCKRKFMAQTPWSCKEGRSSSRRRGSSLLHLLKGARPIALEQARQGPVGEQLAVRLTARAVVALVCRIDDALDLRPARRTRLAI